MNEQGTWQGRRVQHAQFGRGLVLTDIADRATHTKGRLRVCFDRLSTRRWVDARGCSLAAGD